jgi:type II restriction enzyme
MLINIQDDLIRLDRMGLLPELLVDKTGGGRILWGTNAYEDRGEAYRADREISRGLILGDNLGVIRTRARKDFEQQSERTRQHAEVFTPRWICNRMIDAIDADWFGLASMPDDGFKDMDRLFEKKKWKRYVDSKRLEITCGEGPFLMERYDAVTGDVVPVTERQGILDRKFRVLDHFTETKEDWLHWALRAVEATYGYEFQGDNLLIARINMVMTLLEWYEERWQEELSPGLLKKLGNKVSWNLWQMDGITNQLPYEADVPVEMDLFQPLNGGLPETTLKSSFCRIMDWRNEKKSIVYENIKGRLTGMKFDYIIGNPPYQDKTKGNNTTYAPQVYPLFMDEAYKVGRIVELIHPARFLFNAGSTSKDWNNKRLNDVHFKVLKYEVNSAKIFPNISLPGGIAVSYYNADKKYDPIIVFTPFTELNQILHKVIKDPSFKSIEPIVQTRTAYRLTPLMHSEHPEAINQVSKGHAYDMSSNIFDVLPQIFYDSQPADNHEYIRMYGRQNGERTYKFIRKDYVKDVWNLNAFKIVLSQADGAAGTIGNPIPARIIGHPIIESPNTGTTESFISIGAFKNENEAGNALKYIKGKFARTLVSVLKVTQAIPPGKWKYVPLQDFTEHSDIDWTQSIHDIDQQLYKKYGLSDEEISFIETHVKEMK